MNWGIGQITPYSSNHVACRFMNPYSNLPKGGQAQVPPVLVSDDGLPERTLVNANGKDGPERPVRRGTPPVAAAHPDGL